METIGLRELRQRASEYLRRVEAGHSLEITTRGRPVAMLVPIRGANRSEQLVREGRVTPPAGDLLRLGAPLRPKKGAVLPGDTLARARAHER